MLRLIADLIGDHVQIVQIRICKRTLVAGFYADEQRPVCTGAEDVDLIPDLRAYRMTEGKAVFHIIKATVQQSGIIHIGFCQIAGFFHDMPHFRAGKPERTGFRGTVDNIIDPAQFREPLQDRLMPIEVRRIIICQRNRTAEAGYLQGLMVIIQAEGHGLRIKSIAEGLQRRLELRSIRDAGPD